MGDLRPVREIGSVPDMDGRPVHVCVDYEAVVIDAPVYAALGPEVRGDFARLFMQADTEAKAYAAQQQEAS